MGAKQHGFQPPSTGERAEVDFTTQKSISRRLLKTTSPLSLPLVRSGGMLASWPVWPLATQGQFILGVWGMLVGCGQTGRRQGWAWEVMHAPLSSLSSLVGSWGQNFLPDSFTSRGDHQLWAKNKAGVKTAFYANGGPHFQGRPSLEAAHSLCFLSWA